MGASQAGQIHTKQRILEAAIALFSQDGYSAVSVRDLTRAIGIKESSLYNHFKSKDAILEAVYAHFAAELAKVRPPENLAELVRTLPAEQILQGSLRTFLAQADTPLMAQIYRIIVVEQFRDPRARDLMLGLYEHPLASTCSLFAMITGRDPADLAAIATTHQYALHALVAEFSLLKHHGLDTEPITRRMQHLIHSTSRLLESFTQKEGAHDSR